MKKKFNRLSGKHKDLQISHLMEGTVGFILYLIKVFLNPFMLPGWGENGIKKYK